MKLISRTLLVHIFWTVIATGLAVLCLSAVNYKKNMPLKSISVEVEGADSDAYFLVPSDIEREILKIIGPLAKHTVGDVSCDVIEQELSKNPFIENVDVYVSGNSQLTARITQREPILRVISEGQNFYLDSKGNKVPVSKNYTPRVHVLTGPMAAKHAQDVLGLVQFIKKDKLLQAFIEQIHYAAGDQIILVPALGHAQILFGAPDRIAEKFENLKEFYSEVVNETGWDIYSSIDLRFRDQIICKKIPTS